MTQTKQHLVTLSLTLNNSQSLNPKTGTIEIKLANVSQKPIKAWGFTETTTQGPDLTPYIEFHLSQIKDGKKNGNQIQTHRMLPPINDLSGKPYELKPGQAWSQSITYWIPEINLKSFEPGQYIVWAEFDDIQTIGYILTKKDSIGKIVSEPIEFKFSKLTT